mmetsp:Transcript_27079/g.45128  ORF Transcript_27079/g.45128 Transcript_27079/m.45128 type:complete len:197 (+) Transcript_27079:122-712(+)|eukprot:CAMPEP_0119015154 /NCGR_PEP_ID=MMETSP1176-20130426/10588_1 /TAXON_ID=265551 /ORGANISM="Synedropsis recta cf, Strain CCMP1620" /LENGTH=196 /DNA_ID=CAMNT_0006968423 /DNA_START=122 /DNA_END=712 /DNA_ORIENTATION=+
MKTTNCLLAITIGSSALLTSVSGFSSSPITSTRTTTATELNAVNRRAFVASIPPMMAGFAAAYPAFAADDVKTMLAELEESQTKIAKIPALVASEEWEAIRAILKTPPVNNLWNMGDGKNPLLKLSKETDAMELIDMKDELSISLQMTDQFVYSNEFIYFQPGDGKVKIKEPTELAKKAISQLAEALEFAKTASTE